MHVKHAAHWFGKRTRAVRKTGEQFQFVAGLAGVTQAEDLSLRPLVGWAIAEVARIDKLIARLRLEHEVEPPSGLDPKQLLKIFEDYLPADLWRFYSETNGAWLEGEDALGEFGCSIYAALQVHPAVHRDSRERELKFLAKQGLITKECCAERIRSMRWYADLRAFAETYNNGSSHNFYVFGNDPEPWATLEAKSSRGTIFRWTGEPTPEAFEPVAHTFSDWLEAMLERFPLKSK